eukprot:1537264-Pyramimonas_sp.AAC.1
MTRRKERFGSSFAGLPYCEVVCGAGDLNDIRASLPVDLRRGPYRIMGSVPFRRDTLCDNALRSIDFDVVGLLLAPSSRPGSSRPR